MVRTLTSGPRDKLAPSLLPQGYVNKGLPHGTLFTTISNSAPKGKLVYTDICGALLSEEICRKSMITSQVGETYNVQDFGYGKNQ